MISVLSVVGAFSLVIFVHEFGHFYIGKKCGIGVKEFSIGFGPKIIWFKDRSGVIWKLCAIPLGGFVKFAGDSDPASMRKMSDKEDLSAKPFYNASIKARALTVLAGPFTNIIFSILVFSILVYFSGVINDQPVIGEVKTTPNQNLNIKKGDIILSVNGVPTNSFSDILLQYGKKRTDEAFEVKLKRGDRNLIVTALNLFPPIVKDIEMLSPSSRSGIEIGDLILRINKTRISSFSEIKTFVESSVGEPLVLDIWRDGIEIQKTLTPQNRPIEMEDGSLKETVRIGIIGGFALEPERITPDIVTCFKWGLFTTWRVIYGSIKGLIEMVKGSISAANLTGPVGIAHAITDVSKGGLVPFFSLVALISTGIAVINLFPLPILDGGHLILLIYEKLSGSAPSEGFMQVFMMFGLALLLSLMLFATYNDLMRIIL